MLFLQVVGGSFNELLWQQEALQLYNDMLAKGENQLAADWKAFYPSYHQQHTQYSVQQVLDVMTAELLTGAISNVTGSTTNVFSGVASGAAKGAEQASKSLSTITNPLDWLKYPADFLHRLTEASTWIRVGEFIVGGMLIYVGIKAVVSPGVSSAAKSGVQKSKGLGSGLATVYKKTTPTGRATSVIAKHERNVARTKTITKADRIRKTGKP